MAIENTTIADLVPNEKLLGQTVNLMLKDANELVTSGLAVRAPEFDEVAGSGPRKASIPFILPLATDVVNITSDVLSTAGNVGKLEAKEFLALRHDLNYGWGTADLSRMVTQYDAKGGIAAGIADYWNGIAQLYATSSFKGAFGADAGLVHGDGTAAFSYDLVIDATATADLFADLFDTLIVHPTIYAKMRKDQENAFVPGHLTVSKFDEWAGFKLIKSLAFGATATVVARSGALAFGDGVPAGLVQSELERVANGANGGGGDILHSRRSMVIHPQGMSYVGAGQAPDYAALETASNWDIATGVAVEQIGFRKISHL